MRLSPRSKESILLSVVAILTIVSAFMVTLVSPGAISHAATASTATATYNAVSIKAKQVAASPTLPNGSTKPHNNPTSPQVLDNPFEGELHDAKPQATVQGVPVTTSTSVLNPAAEGKLLHNFNGISDADQAAANGGIQFTVTPPDQGLCVGHDPSLSGNPTVVFESVNDAVAEYSPSGKLLRPIFSQAGFLGDPFAFSDPRCFYDAGTKTFFFTFISCVTCSTDTFDDVAVFNAHGFALYQFNTTAGGNCFGDQPHVGYDNNNLYLATDEFCNAGYEGALLIAVSKSQLVQEVAFPSAVGFGPVSLGGIPILTLEPAISPGIGTEYLLNSFPFDQFGNSNSVDNSLGFWQVHNGQNLSKAVLTGRIITSETYAFPQPAASTGNGSVTNVCISPLPCLPITSEAFLNPDDDRMLQVQAVSNGGHVDLYAALDTALTIKGDPSARDGAAWFKINAANHSFEAQGYVAVTGSYLLYPAIYHTSGGTTALVFTITSPSINPAAAYTVMKSDANSFGGVTIAAAGAGPHLSFSDAPPFNRPRWGDYSAATALGPNGTSLWMATEYIPPAADQDPLDNWGTRVFDVAGN